MKVGIGITTYHRYDVADYSISQWEKFTPEDFELIVVKDIKGIARAKNMCLRLLDEAGVDHFFLADEDCYPIAYKWWKPYVECEEPHLMYQFKLPNKPNNDMQEVYRDDSIVAYTHTRGAMIYIHRVVLEVVGGMDEAYGLGAGEHTDWTNRIHNAGLTTHRAMDVVGSDKLLYCLDQDGKVESSINPTDKLNNLKNSRRLYKNSKTSREYKEYRW